MAVRTQNKVRRINESQLRAIIKEAVTKCLKESDGYYSVQDIYNIYLDMKEKMGADALLEALVGAMDKYKLIDYLKFINRNYETDAFNNNCEDGTCDDDYIDEGIMNAVKKGIGKAKELGKKISDYADKEWEDEPVKKKVGTLGQGVNSGKIQK